MFKPSPKKDEKDFAALYDRTPGIGAEPKPDEVITIADLVYLARICFRSALIR